MPGFFSIQICSLTDKQTGRKAGKQVKSQADRETYVQKNSAEKDKVQKDKCNHIHVHFCTDIHI